MVDRKIDKILTIVIAIIALFGILIIYQILKALLGGSWSTEQLILSLTMFNLSAVFTLVTLVATFMSDHKHLSRKFDALALDFKEFMRGKK